MAHVLRKYLMRLMAGVGLVFLFGCSKKSGAESVLDVSTPKEAAVVVEKVFEQAPPEVKQDADTAAQALRSGDYEAAIERLHAVRQGQNMTMEQGMAIQRAMATLETDLMRAVERGDEKAKKAYELLRQRNRN